MPQGLRSAALAVLLLGAAAGCDRPRVYWVDQLQVEGATVDQNPLLGLGRTELEAELRQRLIATRRFRFASAGQKPPADAARVRVRLEVPFTREAMKHGRPDTFAEVGGVLELSLRGPDGAQTYEVLGLGQVQVSPERGRDRSGQMREALGQTLDQVADGARLQLDALDKPGPALAKDLQAEDPRVREYAIAVLAHRRDPTVVPALLERLGGDDPAQVRRTIGQLVDLGDARAGPALIDLSRGKDLGFQREILFALGSLGGDDAEAYLFTVAQGHDQPAIRAVASQALDELKNRRGSVRAEEKQ